MNTPNNEAEVQSQASAEQAEKNQSAVTNDAQVALYRVVHRALAQPVAHGLPENFAATVMVEIQRRERRAEFEDLLNTGLLVLLVAMGLYFVYPFLGRAVDMVLPSFPLAAVIKTQLQTSLAAMPWPTLLAAGFAAMAAVWLERMLPRWR